MCKNSTPKLSQTSRCRLSLDWSIRGKSGTKKSLLVEGGGGPLGVVIAPANVHDTKLLAETLDSIVVERPKPSGREPQNLSLDKAFDNPTGREAAASREYVPHIRRIGEEKLDAKKRKRHPARRWVGWTRKGAANIMRVRLEMVAPTTS